MGEKINFDGQPINRNFNSHRNLLKSTESLLGIIRGLLADCHLSKEEISFLDFWISDNPEVTESWPGDVIAERLSKIMEDGIITDEEAEDLKELLSQIIGGGVWVDGVSGGMSTTLPLDTVDKIVFEEKVFCFTGKFIFGPRSSCEKAVINKGSKVLSKITKELDYLIVGALASRDWANTSFGRKIESAIKNKEKGCPTLIVSEKIWCQHI